MTNTDATLLIRGGRLIDPASRLDAPADLLIEKGQVRRIGTALLAPPEVPVLDATGLVVAPGFIDAHVHLREPGFEYKETIASGTAAAASGGICALAAMPNTNPPPDTGERVEEARRRASSAPVRVYQIGCITLGRQGKCLAPLEELARAGAVAFSDDGDPVEDEALMRRALELGRQLGVPLFPHEEVKGITAGGCMHEGQVSKRLGVKGMPSAGEEVLIARDIELVRQTGGPLHIAHISTAGTVELVRRAKAAGLPVTSEVLTHHFILTDEEVERQGTQAKMSPPLRSHADVEAMLRGLAEGVIDTIATDHAPHASEEKKRPLTEAPFGIVGLETAVGLTLTHLVHAGVLNLAQAVEKWTWAPARILHLPGGHLGIGAPGDVTLIDLDKVWTVDTGLFRSKSQNTPFEGWKLRGKAVATVVGGRIVYSELGER